jgi:PHD/YefM family antitoxin component YafN of YafNO toxin-antitoxin module
LIQKCKTHTDTWSLKKLEQLINSNKHHKPQQTRQLYIIKQINQKLVTENAVIAQADKGKTIVITNAEEYNTKVHAFIDNKTSSNCPKTLQRNTIKNTKTLQQCNLVIPQKTLKKTHPKETFPVNSESTTKTTQTRHTHPACGKQPASTYIQNRETHNKNT